MRMRRGTSWRRSSLIQTEIPRRERSSSWRPRSLLTSSAATSVRRICRPPPSMGIVSSLRGTRPWTISRLVRNQSWWRPPWLPGVWTSQGWAVSSIMTCPRRGGRTSTSTELVSFNTGLIGLLCNVSSQAVLVGWAILARQSPSWTGTTTPSF